MHAQETTLSAWNNVEALYGQMGVVKNWSSQMLVLY